MLLPIDELTMFSVRSVDSLLYMYSDSAATSTAHVGILVLYPWSVTFRRILSERFCQEIISTAILPLSLIEEEQLSKNVLVLVNCQGG